jgi:hypothetical protein
MAELKNQNLTKIMRGYPVRIYLNPTFNADGTVLNVQPDHSLVVADHPNGIEIGYTQDGAELTVSRTREGLPVDQRLTDVLPSLTGQVPHLKFGHLQVLDFETLAKLTPGSEYHDEDDFEGVSDQADQTIELHSVVAIAPMASDKTRSQVLIVYACSNVADTLLKLSKAWHKMPVDFQGEDAGRADGKTWFAYATKAPAP